MPDIQPALARTLVPLLLGGVVACSPPPPPPDAAAGAVTPAAAGAVQAVPPVPDPLPAVVARVNGVEVSSDELERAIRAAETQAGQALPLQFRDQVYRRILDRLIDFHLLLLEARTRGVRVADAEVEDEIARVRESYPTADAFDAQIRSWNTTLEELREETRKDLLVAKTIESEVLPQTGLDDPAVRAFYDQHPDQFTDPETVDAWHILIEVAPDAPAAARDAARAEATTLRTRLVDEGAAFAELARAHSDDPGTAGDGGALGRIRPGQTAPAFEAALFALAADEVSEVVESPFGFHIIRAGERRPESVVPFDRARDRIHAMLVEQERQLLMRAFVARLRESGDVDILI